MIDLPFGRYAFGVCVAVATLAGCGGAQAPLSWKGVSAAPSAKYYCAGTNGVAAAPCPVVLKRSNGGRVLITISGPEIITTTTSASGCNRVCVVYQVTATQWLISSQAYCGKEEIAFNAYEKSVQIGDAFVEVVNKYGTQGCP